MPKKKDIADDKLNRFQKAVEAALENEGFMPPEWAGHPTVLRVMLTVKELAVTHRKAQHGCYDFNCPECDQ